MDAQHAQPMESENSPDATTETVNAAGSVYSAPSEQVVTENQDSRPTSTGNSLLTDPETKLAPLESVSEIQVNVVNEVPIDVTDAEQAVQTSEVPKQEIEMSQHIIGVSELEIGGIEIKAGPPEQEIQLNEAVSDVSDEEQGSCDSHEAIQYHLFKVI